MKAQFKTTQILSIDGPKFKIETGDLSLASETLTKDEYQDFLTFLQDQSREVWISRGDMEVIKHDNRVIRISICTESILIDYDDFLSEFEGAFNGF